MARSIATIHSEIKSAITSDSILSGLTSRSATAIFNLFSYIIAVVAHSVEVIFDTYTTEINALFATLKPHTLRWYVGKAKQFQYGSELVEDNDYYADVVESQQVVASCAAEESQGILYVKIARLNNNEYEKLSTPQYNAFVNYINEVKDAGVNINVINFEADRLKLVIDIFYNAQILDSSGQRIDGQSATPVSDAVNTFLKNTPYNGVFLKSKLTDALQAVEGVIVPEIRQMLCSRFDVQNFETIDIYYKPFSGHLRLYDVSDLVINYIPYV